MTMPYFLKRKTSTGETRHQARVFAGKDQAGRAIMLVETFGTRKEANAWADEKTRERSAGTLVVNQCTMATLFDDLLLNFKINRKSPWAGIVIKAHLRPYFGAMRADQIATSTLNEYVAIRQEKGRANGTINRELTLLRRTFNMARECTPPKVSRVPKFPKFKESAARKGFFEDHEYRALLAALPEEIRPVLTFGYYSGCRKGEVLALRWDQVDLKTRMVELEADQTKTDEARTIPLGRDLLETLRMQREIRDRWHPRCPWVFFRHATGQPLNDFRGAWKNACKRAGLWDAMAGKLDKNGQPKGKPTRIFHDLRRTAVRNLVQAGNPEKDAMLISGHTTRSIFDRYNISSKKNLLNAADKQQAHLDAIRSSTPVVHGPQDEQASVPEISRNLLN
jgi:integrase